MNSHGICGDDVGGRSDDNDGAHRISIIGYMHVSFYMGTF